MKDERVIISPSQRNQFSIERACSRRINYISGYEVVALALAALLNCRW